MKNKKTFLGLAVALMAIMLFTAPVFTAIIEMTDSFLLSSIIMTGIITFSALYATSGNHQIFKNGVEVEVWANYIMERLWKNNQFLQHAFSDDDKVIGGKIVHIPQPGAKPLITKNRSVYPATAVRRTDTDILYALDEYTADPTHIPNADKVELSYDKIDSVYGDHAGQISQDVADDAIIKWLTGLAANKFIRTTGANTSEILEGATGTRKVFVHGDLRKCQKTLDKQNIPEEDRFALLSADMADQLFESLSNTQYRDFSQYADAKEGIVGRLYGFNIMKRSSVAVASSSLTINPWGAAITATDLDVSFVWQKNAVARALGEVKFFENPDRAEYYGDVYSSLLRFGGRRRRADDFGILAIAQADGA
ncbi:MAG: hypothetical protein M9958_00470 [Chitinophagales bacterium]|nr:hypothetical protein [Chitinophagales bacterium]